MISKQETENVFPRARMSCTLGTHKLSKYFHRDAHARTRAAQHHYFLTAQCIMKTHQNKDCKGNHTMQFFFKNITAEENWHDRIFRSLPICHSVRSRCGSHAVDLPRTGSNVSKIHRGDMLSRGASRRDWRWMRVRRPPGLGRGELKARRPPRALPQWAQTDTSPAPQCNICSRLNIWVVPWIIRLVNVSRSAQFF